MVNYINENLFELDSIKKDFIITTEDGDIIDNTKIHSESFKLSESLCSENSIVIGSCEASSISFKISRYDKSLKNKKLKIQIVLDNDEENIFDLGEYYVDSAKLDKSAQFRNITAYDKMYEIINADLDKWYGTLEFPILGKDLRDSFFEYFGIEQVETSFYFDDLRFASNTTLSSLSGKQFINSLCQLSGSFGHINREGKFEYIKLPSNNTYNPKTWKSAWGEEFNTVKFSGLTITDSSNDFAATVGDEELNVYKIDDNVLVATIMDLEPEDIAANIFENINNISYKPFDIELRGNPCVEVGDNITFTSASGEITNSIILQRSLTGIQSLTDKLSAEGTEEVDNKSSSRQYYLEGKIAQIVEKSAIVYKTAHNNKNLTVSSEDTEVFSMQVTSTEDCIVMLSVSIPYIIDCDGDVICNILIDEVLQDDRIFRQHSEKGYDILSFTDYFAFLKNQSLTITVKLKTAYVESETRQQNAYLISLLDYVKTGEYIEPIIDTTTPILKINNQEARGVIFSQNVVGEGAWDGTLTLSEYLEPIDIIAEPVLVDTLKDTISISTNVPKPAQISDILTPIVINPEPVGVGLIDNIEFNRVIQGELIEFNIEGNKYLTLDDSDSIVLETRYLFNSIDDTIDEGSLCSVDIATTDKQTIESLRIYNE